MSAVKKKLSQLEGQNVEQSDIEAIVDEMERQEDAIEDIREGYQELGEMMELILRNYKNSR